MFLRIIIVFLVLSCSLNAQDLAYTHEVINKLTSTKFYGRGYVKNGDKIAANYLANEFKSIGLFPITSTYFQEFSFPVNSFPKEIKLSINGKELIPGKDFLVNAGSRSLKLKATISKPGNSANNIKSFVIDTIDKDANNVKKNPILLLNNKHSNLQIQVFDKKLTWTVSTHLIDTAQIQILSTSLPEIFNSVNVEIKNKFIANHATQNIVGIIPGISNVDSFLVVTAHYDHLGMMGNKTIFPGANDNASGISMLLNLAKHFSQKENRLTYNLVFICFAGEEAGLLGSKYFTENPLIDLKKIRFLLNLDLLGTGDNGMMVVNAEIHPEVFQKLDSINNANHYLSHLGKRGKAKNSDHFYFTEMGVPAFFCYTLGGISAYHDIYDIANTLPLTKYRESYSLLRDFISIY